MTFTENYTCIQENHTDQLSTKNMENLVQAICTRMREAEKKLIIHTICIEVIRKELEISGIQEVRLKYKQNWINHLERMDNTRLTKHALNYKPQRRRDRGRPRKRWQWVDA